MEITPVAVEPAHLATSLAMGVPQGGNFQKFSERSLMISEQTVLVNP